MRWCANSRAAKGVGLTQAVKLAVRRELDADGR
jgi:hypothetical protein